MIGRTLLSLFSSTVLALTSVLILLLAGHLWDRYSQETEALGFNGVYERFLALQAGFPDDPTGQQRRSARGRRKLCEKRQHWKNDGKGRGSGQSTRAPAVSLSHGRAFSSM